MNNILTEFRASVERDQLMNRGERNECTNLLRVFSENVRNLASARIHDTDLSVGKGEDCEFVVTGPRDHGTLHGVAGSGVCWSDGVG